MVGLCVRPATGVSGWGHGFSFGWQHRHRGPTSITRLWAAQPLWEPVVEVLGRVWGVTVTSQTVSMLSLQLNCHGRMPCRRQLAAGSKLWVTL